MKTQKRRGPKPKISKTLDAAILVRALRAHNWCWAAAESAVVTVTRVPVGNIRRYLSSPIQPVMGSINELARFAILHHGWLVAAKEEGFPKLLTEPTVCWLKT